MTTPDWLTEFKNGPEFAQLAERPIAYFCAEYALDPKLPIYAGGLGVLAGDYIRETNDLLIPVVGVGLFYANPNTNQLTPMHDDQGKKLLIDVPIQDRTVKVAIIRYMVGETPVYLLDTNTEENSPDDRAITAKIYIGDKETRLKQEIILGIGGLRALEALKIHPLKYHLNEGHSALLTLELIHHEMQTHSLSLEDAISIVRNRVVFTNHTLLPAGREVYSNDLVALMLGKYAQEIGVPVTDLVQLGLVQESSTFSMTMLSLRMANMTNAVSRLHAEKGTDIWADHPMKYVTNGIHLPTWDKISGDLATSHQEHKKNLLRIIGKSWPESTLLLGWARRFVEYKRPLAILENLERFMALARDSKRPFKIVFAGEPHESDTQGKEMIGKLNQLITDKIGDVAIYLPHYDFGMAQTLVSSCDVWLNTPIVGYEACGTSGMKAALNGVLPASTRDGWVDEVDMYKIGWILDSDHLPEDILNVLEKNILPMYYAQKDEWLNLMNNARTLIQNQFSTTRMLHQYLTELYFPR